MDYEDNKIIAKAVETIATQIIDVIKKNSFSYDITFPSVITEILQDGKYIILDETGTKRKVSCAIPSLTPLVGNHVWVTIPKNNISKMYISGLQ